MARNILVVSRMTHVVIAFQIVHYLYNYSVLLTNSANKSEKLAKKFSGSFIEKGSLKRLVDLSQFFWRIFIIVGFAAHFINQITQGFLHAQRLLIKIAT